MTPKILLILITFAALSIALALLKKRLKPKIGALSEMSGLTKRDPLTAHEKKMYAVLKVALPNHVVFAQVALSALVNATTQAKRNRIDRKVADFVICSKALEVIAIIELDDSSHKGKEQRDQERDQMLNRVGYRTIRYAKIPSIANVQAEIDGQRAAEPQQSA